MHETVPIDILRECLERRWDRDQGRAMQAAETILSKPAKKYSWSPYLRNAGIIRRYWKLRQQSESTSINLQLIFNNMEEHIKAHDISFALQRRYEKLTQAEISSALTSATRKLRVIQRKSTSFRFNSYHDLLAEYESDRNPQTSQHTRLSDIGKEIFQKSQPKHTTTSSFPPHRRLCGQHITQYQRLRGLIVPTNYPPFHTTCTNMGNHSDSLRRLVESQKVLLLYHALGMAQWAPKNSGKTGPSGRPSQHCPHKIINRR